MCFIIYIYELILNHISFFYSKFILIKLLMFHNVNIIDCICILDYIFIKLFSRY